MRGKFAIKLCFTNLWISCAINSLRSFPFQQVRHIYVLVVQRIHTISKFTTSNLLLIFIVTHITTVPYPFLNCPLFNETNSKIRTFHNNFDTENEKKITTSNCYENNQRFGLKNRLKEFLVIGLQCVRVCFSRMCTDKEFDWFINLNSCQRFHEIKPVSWHFWHLTFLVIIQIV